MIVILFMSGNTPILRHFDEERSALIETDESDFDIGAVLFQQFADGKIHPCAFLSRKLPLAEFNYDIFDNEMPVIVYALQKWRYSVLGTANTTMIFSDHQNLQYFTNTANLNRRQTR